MMTMSKFDFSNARKIWAAALLALFMAGCASTSAGTTKPVTVPTSEYTVGVGDKVRVNVYGQEEISNEYTVEPGGMISLPLIGTVGAAGYSAQEIKDAIYNKLHPDYMVDPKVSVELVGFRNMYVLGEVQQPGKYEYVPNMTVMQAVAVAGGYTYRANEGGAEVTRHVKGGLSTFTVDERTMLKPGDTILIKRRWF